MIEAGADSDEVGLEKDASTWLVDPEELSDDPDKEG